MTVHDPVSFTIRPATTDDLDALIPLMHQMEEHYQGDRAISLELIRNRLQEWFGRQRDSLMLVAWRKTPGDKVALGHAVIVPLFPAGDLNTAWFVKDIYVAAQARGQGIGEALLQQCAHETVARGGTRLDLTVDAGNDGARSLYERLGATDTRKTYLRWDGEGLQTFAER